MAGMTKKEKISFYIKTLNRVPFLSTLFNKKHFIRKNIKIGE